jgi:hypothetical protein
MSETAVEVQIGTYWTERDQDYRDSINYWHVRDEDLFVRVWMAKGDEIGFYFVKNPDRREELALSDFTSKFRVLNERELELLAKLKKHSTFKGKEYVGPWTIRICAGCGRLLGGIDLHHCDDDEWISDERAIQIQVVRRRD